MMIHSRWRKLFSYYKPYRKLFFIDMGCAFAASMITLSIPLCIRSITKNLETGPSLPHIGWVGVLLLCLIACYAVCQVFIDYQGHVMGARMEKDMRDELFRHYQKLSFKFFDENRTGQLMTRITHDSYDLAELFHHGPEDLVIASCNFIGAFVILSFVNMKLALITLLFIPLMGIYGFYFSRRMQQALRRSRDRIGDLNAQAEDTLAGIRVVQSFTNETIETEKFASANKRFFDSRREAYKSEAYLYDGLVTFTQLMTASVVIFGAICILRKTLDLADLITFLLYSVILIEPIQRLGNFIRLYQEGIAGFHRMMEALETKPGICDTAHAKELVRVEGAIEFKDVSFKYKDEHSHVLQHITLRIQAKEYVALVGSSGVGKTTLCSLIPRFYEISDGAILLDGMNIRDLTLQSLRRQIGIVHQDSYLFSGSVRDNIRYGKPDASELEIALAAQRAQAHDFILGLPNGYDTDIGQRGVKLSGGQKQRLSIARVFLKNPPIVILDEATSALDYENERALQKSLEALLVDRTVIVIAHRLSTIRNAKRILVLTERGIEEEGTHDELLLKKGAYARLYNAGSSLG